MEVLERTRHYSLISCAVETNVCGSSGADVFGMSLGMSLGCLLGVFFLVFFVFFFDVFGVSFPCLWDVFWMTFGCLWRSFKCIDRYQELGFETVVAEFLEGKHRFSTIEPANICAHFRYIREIPLSSLSCLHRCCAPLCCPRFAPPPKKIGACTLSHSKGTTKV